MKKIMTMLVVLLCLFTSMITIRPVMAEDEPVTEEITETFVEEGSEETLPDETEAGEEETPEVPVETSEETPEVVQEEPVTEEEPVEEETPEETENEGLTLPEKDPEEKIDGEVVFEIPEGFVLNELDIEGKKLLKDNNVPDLMQDLEADVDYVRNELVFPEEDEERARAIAEIYHGELTSFGDGVAVVTVNDGLTSFDAVEAYLDEDSALPFVELNYINRLDPVEPEVEDLSHTMEAETLPEVKGWQDWVKETFGNPDPYLSTPSAAAYQWQHDLAHTYDAWNATMGKSSIKVAVLDLSVNPNHEELSGRVTIQDIGCGTYYGNGHGTHVAGIIAAAANNGKGGAGIAPNVSIIGINVFANADSYTSANLGKAIDRARTSGANIISMSLGGPMFDVTENVAIQKAYNAGIVMVAAAGNDGSNVKSFPACYDHVISVASVTKNGTKASYSNYGPWITISAPGSFIYSSLTTTDNVSNTAYGEMSGTSQATPVVSGAIALYMSKMGAKSYDEIVKVLKASASKTSSKGMGYGIIDLSKMFGAKADAPTITVGTSSVTIRNYNPGNQDRIVYTTDGKSPSIKNGEVVNGTMSSGTGSVSISLSTLEKNKKLTIKAATVNSLGVMGKIATLTFTNDVGYSSIKVSKLTLNATKITLQHKSSAVGTYYLTPTIIDVNGNTRSTGNFSNYQWISSNPKVATVNTSGRVTTVGAGTAKITLKLNDGNKKSVTCTVTVVQLPESATITGQDAIAQGGSATFKATVNPSTAKDKKVVWTVSNTALASVTAKGKVTVAKTAAVNSSFYVYAWTSDGTTRLGSKRVYVRNLATKVTLNSTDSRAVYSKGVLKSANIFSVDLPNTSIQDNQLSLTRTVAGYSAAPVLWTSSNTKVAEVNSSGVVTAHAAGKATITCTANDGSKKKASVTVNVKVPVSSLKIDLGEKLLLADGNSTAYYMLAEGKSLNMSKKALFGNTYGKPSLAKAEWSINRVAYSYDGVSFYTVNASKYNKIITLSKTGTLKVAKNAYSKINSSAQFITVQVKAVTTDGTGYIATDNIVITTPIKSLSLWFYNGSWWNKVKSNTTYLLSQDASYGFEFDAEHFIPVEAKSSNPKVAGVIVDGWSVYIITYPGCKGTATITLKALDGSGKTCKIKVKVR